jgi:hypothetical protein
MKIQKFLIVKDTNEINQWLSDGWEVISVTAQHVSVSTATPYATTSKEFGNFAVLLQKQKIK